MPKGMRMKITEDFTPGEFTVTGINDENGQPYDCRDSANDSNGSLPKKILVVVESTHTGVNRNKVEYTYNGLENSVGSWTDNYNKPVLLNHNPYSDNIGRVKQSEFCQSVIDSSKYCIKLTLEVTNAAAIERFLDGRYKTFSIGGYTDSAKCSICGKDQITDGWCGHSRGRKYDGKEAYWTLGKMEYDEISVVNCPADVNAQAIDIKVVSDEPKGEDGFNGNDGGVPVADMYDNIDNLLGGNKHTDNDNGEPGLGEDNNTAQPTENGSPEKDANGVTIDNVNEDAHAQKITELEASLTEKDATIADLEGQLQTSQTTVSDMSSQLEAKDSDIADANAKLQIAQDEKQILVKQNVDYAKFAHKVLCEKVADMQILSGAKTAEERDAIIQEYTVLTTKKLNDMSNEILAAAPKITERAHVTNPVQVTDGEQPESPNDSDAPKTLGDFEDAVTKYFRSKI